MKYRAFLLTFSHLLGMTETQAVELSKVLQADPEYGQDFKADRRGPGGGPDATPYNVTKLLIATLAGGPQTRARLMVPTVYSLQPEGSDSGVAEIVPDGAPVDITNPSLPCEITGARFFGDAIQAILKSPRLAERIRQIDVVRGGAVARIVTTDAREQWFGDDVSLSDFRAGRSPQLISSLVGSVLADMARDIASAD